MKIIAQPFTTEEDAICRQTFLALQQYLGLSTPDACAQARRVTLLRRERIFHEALLLDLAPDRLSALLDRVKVIGLDHLQSNGRGVLLVAPHYSLFSSLLCLWLARSAAHALPSRLSILIDTGPVPKLGISVERLAALDAGRLARRDRVTFATLDRPTTALRTLTHRLRDGAAVLLFVDAKFLPAPVRGGIPLNIGRGRVTLPASVPWLASQTGCVVVPAHIQPTGDAHTITFSPPAPSNEAPIITSVIQDLIDQTVVADPGPWDGWTRMPPLRPHRCGSALSEARPRC